MVGTWKSVILVVIATQLAVLIGSICAAFVISRWPGSTASMSPDLLAAILVVALPVVNLVSLLVFLPLQMSGRVNAGANYFVWGGAIVGGLLYLLTNMAIAAFSGTDAFSQFFTNKAFIFPLVVGAIFGGLFCLFYKLLLKWTVKA